MKRTVQLFILLITLNTSLSFSQTNTKEKIIDLKGNSTEEIITINVGENVKSLDLNIKCEIEKGLIFIKLLDPNRKKKDHLLVIYHNSKQKNIVFELANSKLKISDNKRLEIDKGNFYDYIPISKTKFANGEINKKFNLPTEGDWIIKVKSEKGKGKVSVKSKTN
ncbi:hypothetical protein [Winogradskyella immobilis]|uniref:P/Homo B domain-containing protein n=1 Tax=Winogradskyella immobilis TaxID=2816852 RepID=A0ABS8EPE4_9FLAO|nr:hypothetical protein [Winogradskyella immobilis]MCC1485086.1 hypothetical protein [Winogradskyella immobilis]MCG0017178.1 hypothetical protein [Winogradskyella immobilis]